VVEGEAAPVEEEETAIEITAPIDDSNQGIENSAEVNIVSEEENAVIEAKDDHEFGEFTGKIVDTSDPIAERQE